MIEDIFEKVVEWFIVGLFVIIAVLVGSIIVLIFYKEVISLNPSVECRSGKLFEVTTRDNITVYDPTFDDCEVKQ